MKSYNVSFALCSHDHTGKHSEICLWFYFDVNFHFSHDGLVATQAQGQLPSHDGTEELGESISYSIVPPGPSPLLTLV